MKKLVSLLLCLCMVLSLFAVAESGGTITGSAQGFASPVGVEFTVEDGKITALTVDDSGETYPSAGIDRAASVEQLIAAILEAGSTEGIDTATGATFTSKAVVEAINAAMSEGSGEALAFTPGTYEVTAAGYNGPSTFAVTFSEDALTGIEVVRSTETAHVGDIAFAPMIADMIAANGTGVDGVAGATFSARALREAVNAAAVEAGCTNLDAFKSATFVHEAQEPIDLTYDVVIVGAGGAGLAAAAQAAQTATPC